MPARLARYGRDDGVDDVDDASRRYTEPRGTASCQSPPVDDGAVKPKKKAETRWHVSCFLFLRTGGREDCCFWPPRFLSSSPCLRAPNRTPSGAAPIGSDDRPIVISPDGCLFLSVLALLSLLANVERCKMTWAWTWTWTWLASRRP